ncbi:hypothetical protein HID58_029461 [Brassica napus]|uniref:MGS-like domain-containing protein n=1 Tax=Brassica napus TaxID=3708 RepID=A0ABQ8CD92_BRANA|nr:hypothetical protein HID58_029461 [Brassica napus]
MLDMLSSAATSVSARSGDILCGYLHGKTVAPFRFAQPKQHVYSKLMRPSFVAVRAMSESQTALKNHPQSSASSDLFFCVNLQNLTTLGNGLQESGYTIVSTGGTASTLENAGVSVTKVETLTHFPEMTTLIQLDGRVKTLQPNIHGGILARKDVEHHMEALNENGIGELRQDGIENIDIGGPAMIRAAAKYLKRGQNDQQFHRKLALKAFQHVAAYDSAVSEWLWKQTEGRKSRCIGVVSSLFLIPSTAISSTTISPSMLLPSSLCSRRCIYNYKKRNSSEHKEALTRLKGAVAMLSMAAATAALGVRNRVKYMLALVPLNQSPFFLCATLHLPKLRHVIGKRTQDVAVKLQKKMEQSVEILKLKISPAVTAEKKGTTMNYRMNRIMNISYNLIT